MAEVNVNITVNVVRLNKDGSREDLSSLLGRPSDNKNKKIRKGHNV